MDGVPAAKRQRTTNPVSPPATFTSAAVVAAPATPAESVAADVPAGDGTATAQRLSQQSPIASRQAEKSAMCQASPPLPSFSLLTYNIWCEPVMFEERMREVGRIIVSSGCPDLILFQEVTPHSHALFASQAWWGRYRCQPSEGEVRAFPEEAVFTMTLCKRATVHSVEFEMPSVFEDSPEGRKFADRDLKVVRGEVGGERLLAANVHLEQGASGIKDMYDTLAQLNGQRECANVFLAGDTNWLPSLDPKHRLGLPPGWQDAWLELHGPGTPTPDQGHTYDGVHNRMCRSKAQARFDRILYTSPVWRVRRIRRVGMTQIQGLCFRETERSRPRPLYPSDHFGLLADFGPPG
ncbi:hypothetical protein N2152v2_006891 [Parachlorella kessleri]